ncbi:MAG: HNH endonuclease [Archangium sp.]
MKRLQLPKSDPFRVFVQIAKAMRDSARRDYLLDPGTQTSIRRAFKKYRQSAPELHNLRPIVLSSSCRKALRESYSYSQADVADFNRYLLAQIAGKMCFYCRSKRASSLDHVLPRETLPEYSLCIENLVPACNSCNSGKGTKVKLEGDRCFFYAFKDKFPSGRWVFARVKGNRIKFSSRVSNCGSARVQAVLDRQIRQLKLLKRFERNFTDVGWSEVRERAGTNLGKLKRVLKRLAKSSRKEHGPNNYHAVLFEALSKADTAFLKAGLTS